MTVKKLKAFATILIIGIVLLGASGFAALANLKYFADALLVSAVLVLGSDAFLIDGVFTESFE